MFKGHGSTGSLFKKRVQEQNSPKKGQKTNSE